jgi:hypothetical protein
MKNNYFSTQNCFRFASNEFFLLCFVFFTAISANADYKLNVTSSESSSFSERPNFLSTTGSMINFSHIIPTTLTLNVSVAELADSNCAGAIGGSASGSITNCGPITSPTILGTGYSTGDGSTYQWEYSTNNFVGFPANGGIVLGQNNPAVLITGLISTTISYRLRVICSTGTAIAYSNVVIITILPIPSPPTAGINTIISEGFNATSTLFSSGWSVVNTSTPVGTSSWFQGSSAFTAQSGAANSWVGCGFDSVAGANTISNWLIAPQVVLQNGDVIKFWTRTVDLVAFPDRLQVRLSKTGSGTNPSSPTDLGSYTTLLADINPTLTTTGYPVVFTQYTLTVSGLSGPTSCRVGFRYFVPNGGPSGVQSELIGIDTFNITRTVAPLECYQSYVFNNSICGYALSGTPQVAPTGATGTTTIGCGGSTTLTVAGGNPGSGAIAKWYTGSCGGTLAGTGNSILVSPSSTTTYYVRYEGGACPATSCATVTVTVGGSCSIVNLKLFIQGYYDAVNHQMVAAKFNQGVPSATNEVTTLTVQLLNQNSLAVVATTTAELKQDGTAVCGFPTAPNGAFFLKVMTWNTVPTYSKVPVVVSSTPTIYDFTNATSKAAGDNMKLLETGVFGIYSGNFIINTVQDPNIDNEDYSVWEADYNDGIFNYVATDLNGDANPDNADYSIWEGNYNDGIYEILPNPIP